MSENSSMWRLRQNARKLSEIPMTLRSRRNRQLVGGHLGIVYDAETGETLYRPSLAVKLRSDRLVLIERDVAGRKLLYRRSVRFRSKP